MRILIDADACPVVDIAINTAAKNGLKCFLLCDAAHFLEREGAETLVFSTGADSVDFALVNMTEKGDIVITQDYGLAAMCLSKSAFVLNQNGMEYTNENIGALLERRHISRKIRKAGGRTKGPARRTASQDIDFAKKLEEIIRRELS